MTFYRQKSKNKYGAVKCEHDGLKFDSKKEGGRYLQLKMLRDAGEISNLILQYKIPFFVDGQKIFTYIADFAYLDAQEDEQNLFGESINVVEDVKSPITRKHPVYRIKKKCVEAAYKFSITEV